MSYPGQTTHSASYFAPQPRASTQAGFTLIEVLVVLIIVGVTSGILFQALEQSYRLRDRFGVELFKVQQGQMAADWYRQTVQGLQPDYPAGQNLFRGDVRGFYGLSTNPLGVEYGAPTLITWKLRNNQQNGTTELVYIETGRETPILSWRGNRARFVYLDEQQTPHDSWPPPLGLSPQLPRQIQLIANDAGEPVIIVASIMGPVETLQRVQDFIGIKP